MENPSVLVLDHHPASLLTISNMLAKFNFKVLRFQTAAEAIESLERGVVKAEELDLVVAEVHPANSAMDTLVVFRRILDALEVPFVTMCAYDDLKAVSECMTLGSCFNVLKPVDTETVNILMRKALLHRSRRVLPEGSSILKKTEGRVDSSSTKNDGSDTDEDEEHGYSKKLGRFIWSKQLHEKFLQAVEVLGEFATPRMIRRHMNVRNLNLTTSHISSHLQKHRLREQRKKQEEEEYRQYASMRELRDLITSSHRAGNPKPSNHLTTTQMQLAPGVASPKSTNLWAQVEGSSARAKVSKSKARTSGAVVEHGSKSVWDKYEESMAYYEEGPLERLPGAYKRRVLPVKSKDIDPTAAGKTSHGAPASVPLESSGSDCMITSPPQRLNETSRTDAPGANNVNLGSVAVQACYTMNHVQAAVNLQKDTLNQARTAVAPRGNAMNGVHAAAMVSGGSNALIGGTGSSRSTAGTMPSDPVCSWEEAEAFWMSQLEGQGQRGIGPEELLQVDHAWNQALQPATPANVAQAGVAPSAAAAQEPAAGGALAYDPEFSIDDVQVWTPQFAGDDYGMLF